MGVTKWHLSVGVVLFSGALCSCGSTVNACAESSGGVDVADGDFEESPSSWTLAPHSSIDSEQSVCGGQNSLKITLDEGIGSTELTRSAPITGGSGSQVEVAFHYRFEHCRDANLVVRVGGYEHRLKFNGTDGTWKDTSFIIELGSEPMTIDIHPEREGSPETLTGADFQDNRMWVDGFTVHTL